MKKFNTNYDFEKSHIYLNSVNKYLLDEVNNGNLNAFVTLTSNKQMKIDDFLLTLNNCFEQTRNHCFNFKNYQNKKNKEVCENFYYYGAIELGSYDGNTHVHLLMHIDTNNPIRLSQVENYFKKRWIKFIPNGDYDFQIIGENQIHDSNALVSYINKTLIKNNDSYSKSIHNNGFIFN